MPYVKGICPVSLPGVTRLRYVTSEAGQIQDPRECGLTQPFAEINFIPSISGRF